MKKHILFAAGAMLAAVLMTGCGSKPAETTAARNSCRDREHCSRDNTSSRQRSREQ